MPLATKLKSSLQGYFYITIFFFFFFFETIYHYSTEPNKYSSEILQKCLNRRYPQSKSPATIRLLQHRRRFAFFSTGDASPAVAAVFSACLCRRFKQNHDASPSLTPVTPNRDESDADDAQIATLQTPVTPDRDASASNRRRRFSFQSPATLQLPITGDASASNRRRRFILHDATGDVSSVGYFFF